MISILKGENKIRRSCCFVMLLSVAFLSLGAWWGGDKAQKNMAAQEVKNSKQTNPEPKLVHTDSVNVQKKMTPQENSKGEKNTLADDSPEKQQKEVEKIQGELKEIITRTQQLQNQVKNNRSEIQQILQRAQIHEQILRSITLPPAVPKKNQLDPEEIIKHEKLRLIGEQARQTQEQLRVIQQARSFSKPAQVVSSETKTSKAS